MNAAVRAVARKAIYHGVKIYGIFRGFDGLIQGEFQKLDISSVGDIIHRGGTVLRTARSEDFLKLSGQQTAARNLKKAGVEGVVIIGGDGSFRGALKLYEQGIPVVGIPATIDNDIAFTDYSIGFDTAVNTVVEAIDRVRDTATSHERVFIIEVMGRETGHIALVAGIAGGAESILVPEIPVRLEKVSEKILKGRDRGKLHSIILVAEGAGDAISFGKEIKKQTGLDNRVIILGHVQRGGNPTAFDRVAASRLGAASVELLLKGAQAEMVGLCDRKVISCDLSTALQEQKKLDMGDYNLAGILAI